MILRFSLYSSIFLLCLSSCSKTYLSPIGSFESSKIPVAPDYSKDHYWSALPTKSDMADVTPEGNVVLQQDAPVDVFFLYPTLYIGDKGENQWNAPVNDKAFNQKVDESTIKFQASAFNAAGKVYAPRYRQAHFNAYFTKDKGLAKKAFDLAYQDLKLAFEYYLENYNQGRPIIIASHSQGTTHGIKLVKEFFDGTELQDQLVAAYLVGIPVHKNEYDNIPICSTATQTNCFCSWRTFKEGHYPEKSGKHLIAVTNPLSWTITEEKIDRKLNKGGLLRNFNKVKNNLTSAQVVDEYGILWAKPKFFGSMFWRAKNLHIADYNLYYYNVKANAKERAEAFLAK